MKKKSGFFISIYFTLSEYELVKKLGSYDNFKGLKSMAKVPWHKFFMQNKLSVPTVLYCKCCNESFNFPGKPLLCAICHNHNHNSGRSGGSFVATPDCETALLGTNPAISPAYSGLPVLRWAAIWDGTSL